MRPDSGVYGIVAPHPPIMLEAIGGERAAVTAQTTASLRFAAKILDRFDPEIIVVLSPHAPTILRVISVDSSPMHSGSLKEFGAPELSNSYRGSPKFVNELLYRLDQREIPAIDRLAVPALRPGALDHGVVVPMSILDPTSRWQIAPVSTSSLSLATYLTLGDELRRTAEALGMRLAVVGSGDCSHKLTPDAPAAHSPQAAEFDKAMISLISASDYFGLSALDPLHVSEAGQCGLRSFIAVGAATAPAFTRVLSYESPWGVGYLTAIINEHLAPLEDNTNFHSGTLFTDPVTLAKNAIKFFLLTGNMLEPELYNDRNFPIRAGAFVTLHKKGRLRGCIGSIYPACDSLAHEIARSALQAAIADCRFPPVSIDEIDGLTIKVDIINQPQICEFSDLDPKKWGVIVSSGAKKGLLLPDIENIDTPEQQLNLAKQKAELTPNELYKLERFSVTRYI